MIRTSIFTIFKNHFFYQIIPTLFAHKMFKWSQNNKDQLKSEIVPPDQTFDLILDYHFNYGHFNYGHIYIKHNFLVISSMHDCRPNPANTKYLYNICTTSVQHLRRCSNIVEMLHNFLCLLGSDHLPAVISQFNVI